MRSSTENIDKLQCKGCSMARSRRTLLAGAGRCDMTRLHRPNGYLHTGICVCGCICACIDCQRSVSVGIPGELLVQHKLLKCRSIMLRFTAIAT